MNVTSLIHKGLGSSTQKPSVEENDKTRALRDVQRMAWLNNDYTRYFLAGLLDEADNKLCLAQKLASEEERELQLRSLLIEARLLRNIVGKAEGKDESATGNN